LSFPTANVEVDVEGRSFAGYDTVFIGNLVRTFWKFVATTIRVREEEF
jgi:hypothetical protein